MKKRIIFLSIAAVSTIISLLTGCSEENEMNADVTQHESNIVLYEDQETREQVSLNPLDNHIYRIELLKSSDEMETLADLADNETGEVEKLNIYGIKKYFLNHSEGIMYEIPYLRGENSLIVYRFGDLFQVVKAEYAEVEEGINRFRLSTPDGAFYYGMSIKNNTEIGKFEFEDNKVMNDFSRKVYATQSGNMELNDNKKGVSAPCCRKEASWNNCFDCTTSYFNKTWVGKIAFAATGKAFTAAIAFSCIGAGPDAVC